jgi:hypothetical protein
MLKMDEVVDHAPWGVNRESTNVGIGAGRWSLATEVTGVIRAYGEVGE